MGGAHTKIHKLERIYAFKMKSSTPPPSHPKAWVLNVAIKRVVLVLLLIIVVKYAVFDLSYMMRGAIGTITNQPENVPRQSKAQDTSEPDHIIRNLGPAYQVANPGAKNDSTLESGQQKSDEELAKIVANNKLASKNKGVYLPLHDETRSRVWQINEDRKQSVNDVCASKNLRKDVTVDNVRKIKQYTNVAVDDTHKLLYCYVPKVGCTSWKVKLSLMSDNAGDKVLNTHPSPVDTRGGLAKYGIKMLSTYPPEQIKYRIDNYFKFVFVRHPMERIVSSYRSKFEKREDNKVEYPWFYSTYGKHIKNIARKNKTDMKSDITFGEFVTYVIYRSGMSALTDDHWEQYNKLCHLCLIDYDFIGKFDAGMVDDVSYVLRKISDDEADFWFPNVTAPRSANKYLEKYFGSIPTSLVDGLEKGYSLDFELFNFDKGLSAKLNKTSS